MSNKVNFKPPGYPTVSPSLIVKDAAQAIEFYKNAFGAIERFRMPMPDGKIGHAELQLGDSVIMLADEFPEWACLSPQSIGGTPVTLHVYVEKVDEVTAHAVSLGATVTQPVMDQFYGDRSGKITDPFGHSWMLATHIEDVAPEEMAKRLAAACS